MDGWTTNGRTDTDVQRETIIPCHYCVAGYENGLFNTNLGIPLVYALTLTTLQADSADNKLMIFYLFSQKTGFNISCKLSPSAKNCGRS